MKKSILYSCLIVILGFSSIDYVHCQSKNSEGIEIKIAKCKSDKACATSFTFDDGNRDNYVLAVPELEKRGWRGTFWLNCARIPGEIKGVAHLMNWDEIRNLHSRGHEISNHGWDHKKLTKIPYEEAVAEIEKNDSAIVANIGVKPTTFCYAHNSRNAEIIMLASKDRVGTRTYEYALGEQSSDEQLRQRMNDAVQNGKWAVWMTHGLTHGYDHFKELSRFASFLDYVKSHEADIWVGTFREVAAYVGERDAVKLSIEKSKRQIKITPSLVLDPSLFNMPLTMIVKGVKKFKVIQDNSKLTVVYHKDYATFEFNRKMTWPSDDVERYNEYQKLLFNIDNAYGDAKRLDREWMRKELLPAIEFAKNNPDKILWCGEFGTIRHADMASRENYMADVIAICKENNIPYCSWNYLSTPNDGNRFSLVDDETRKIVSKRMLKIIQGKEK